MYIFGLIAVYIIIIIIDMPTLKKQKSRLKVAFVYATIIILGFSLGMAMVTHNTPPSPSVVIEKLLFGKTASFEEPHRSLER